MKDKTIGIILGASRFPKSSNFSGSDCFKNSALNFHDYLFEHLIGGDRSQLLNLFDSPLPLTAQLTTISEFLERIPKEDGSSINVILYYVGHGSVTSIGDNYFLAIRDSDKNNEYHSSLPMDSLAEILNKWAGTMRKYIILDCCFAGSAVSLFQSEDSTVFFKAAMNELPSKGTSLLCASSKWEPAKYKNGSKYTMFYEALEQVLQNGDSSLELDRISFREIGKLTRSVIEELNRNDAIKPELHVPNQKDGDISEIKLFPNGVANSMKSTQLFELIKTKYFEDSLFDFPEYEERILSDFSDLFAHFVTLESKVQEELSMEGELITCLCNKIIKSKSTFPILVDGYTGTGKSLLLGLIYLGLRNIANNINNFCPIYINLHHYEYLVYQSDDIKKTSESYLVEDIKEFLSSPEAKNKEIILIVDGADEYIQPKVDLFHKVIQQKKFQKKIIGIRRFRSEKLKRNVSFPGEPEIKISLNGILREGNSNTVNTIVEKYSKIVADYSGIKSPNLNTELVGYINSLGLYEVDLFSLRLLTEVVENPYKYPVKSTLTNFSSILNIYCQGRNEDADLDNVAKMAFDIFNSNSKRTSKEINNQGWKLIGSHHSVRNYLIARHVYNILSQPNTGDLSVYNFVYPHEVNSHIKQVVNSSLDSQRKVFDGIKKVWDLVDNHHLNTKTHLAYLLGRFIDSFVAESAFQFLSEIESSQDFQQVLKEFENYETNESKSHAVNPKDRPKLLYLRTILS